MGKNDVTKILEQNKTSIELLEKQEKEIKELNEEYFQLAMEFVNKFNELSFDRKKEIEDRSSEIKEKLIKFYPLWVA